MADAPVRIRDIPAYQLARPNIRRCKHSCPGVTLFCSLRTSVPLQPYPIQILSMYHFVNTNPVPGSLDPQKISHGVPCDRPQVSEVNKNRLRYHKYAFNIHGSVRHRKNILIYIQQDATLHSLFYLELLYMFRVVPSPIRVGTGLSVLWVAYATSSNSSAIAAESNNVVTNTRCCKYSCLCS